MHVLVVLIDFASVGLTCKSGKTFLEDINSKWFVACDEDIDTKIEFVAVNQQGVGDVAADDGELVHIYLIDVVYDVDASSSA